MAGGTRSSGIAIIGSGVAGLHLALLLRKQGIPVTLYSEQTAAQLFTDDFNQPERQWDILATPERTSAFLARHGM